MATVYLPVEATIADMTSAERADAINREVWSLRRPDSVKSADDITRHHHAMITHPTTGQVAIIGDTTEEIRVHQDVDLTALIALLPEVPQVEKDGLVSFINANRGGTVTFGNLIPSTSTQLTEAEADAAGWLPTVE